ncbi:MAG: threonine/serine dehydratase [Lachnospiraceae bacterium]|jgi:threonine dehydratase
MEALTLQDIRDAQKRISPYILHTPVLRTERLDALCYGKIYLKAECLQNIGAFKIRGAMNKMLLLSDEEKCAGVIASSSGNHAQGLAYAGKVLGVDVTLILPENAPEIKVNNTKKLGAHVISYGIYSEERWKKVYELAEEKGYAVVHSYKDPQVMAGQGTVGLEILEDLPDVDTVIIPLGGGGLASGIATAIKSVNPKVRVIAAEPKNCAKYYESRKAGKLVEVELKDTVADGLKLNVPAQLPHQILTEYVDEIVAVEDEYIKKAIPMIVTKAKLVPEPSAAIGIGALLSGKIEVKEQEKVCVVISGGNIDGSKLASMLFEEED